MGLTKPAALPAAILGAAILTACGDQQAPRGADTAPERSADSRHESDSLWSRLKNSLTRETGLVPAGTEIQVRLDQEISTAKHTSRERFRATLDRAITVDGKLLAPQGSEVTGELVDVQGSGRVKGRAELTLTLREITVDGRAYSLNTNSLTIRSEDTTKKDAMIVGGSSAVGAIIGAVTGGKKGAAIGAGVGAGGGTGYVLSTKGKEVEYERGTRFVFTLSEALELPVVEKR